MDVSEDEDEGIKPKGDVKSVSASKIEVKLNEMAKKMPMFEPERVEAAVAEEKPLGINLELALYQAEVLIRNFQFQGAEMILQKCILFWPEDGRPYVALGKLLCKQSKFFEVAKQHKERIITFGRLCPCVVLWV